MSFKRSRETIIADILDLCVGGAGKTMIVYKTNMNFKTGSFYIDKLIKTGLLQMINGDLTVYETTEKGREILRGLKDIQREII